MNFNVRLQVREVMETIMISHLKTLKIRTK